MVPVLSTVVASAFAIVGALLWAGAIGPTAALVVAVLLLGRCAFDLPDAGIDAVSSRTAIAIACAFAAVARAGAYQLDPLALVGAALAQLRAAIEWSLSLAPFGLDFLTDFLDDWDGSAGRRARGPGIRD